MACGLRRSCEDRCIVARGRHSLWYSRQLLRCDRFVWLDDATQGMSGTNRTR
jgi:hypothetical protein